MKIVLCSEGFHTPNTVETCIKLVGKPQDQISVAVINEAYAVEQGDKRWVLDNLNSVSTNFPGYFDFINLLALSIEEVEKRILECDVIFVIGGNTDYLMHVFEETGFAKLLPELLQTKVYVGSSAGSMVLGKRPPFEARKRVHNESEDFGVTEYLGFVDFALMPHMNSLNFPNNTAAVLEETVRETSFPVYGLQDDSAIIINGDEQIFIGSDPYEVGSKTTT